MRTMGITLLLAALVIAVAVSRAPALTLDQAVTTALSNNLDLRAAYNEVEMARGRLIQAGLWPNPELDFSASTDRPFNDEGEKTNTAGFQQAFPISGRLRFAKQVSRVEVAQAMAEIRNRERLLIGEVQGDFVNVLLLREQITANRELLGVNAEFVGVFEERLKRAEVSKVDVNFARAEMERLDLDIAVQESDLAARELALKLRLGLAPEERVKVEGSLETLTTRFRPENYDATMVANRPDLRQTELGLDRANAEVRLARAEAWADPTFGADYEFERGEEPEGLSRDKFVGFKISIPLALWNRNQGRVYEQRAAAQKAQQQAEAQRLTIRSEIATAIARARKLREAVQNYTRRTLPALDESTALLRKGYDEGLIAPTQVIQAQQQQAALGNAFLTANTSYLQALVDLETATASNRHLKKDFLINRSETRKSRASSYRK